MDPEIASAVEDRGADEFRRRVRYGSFAALSNGEAFLVGAVEEQYPLDSIARPVLNAAMR